MKISGYKILATILFLLIIYRLWWLTMFIWNQEDKIYRVFYLSYIIPLLFYKEIEHSFPSLINPIKDFLKYIDNFLGKEYKL